MKNNRCKVIIAGIGGQGIVFLTEILADAAVRAGINSGTSEIHGLSQRGGSVMAGVTFGDNTFGFVENGGADFLLGLELLEARRCSAYLHKGSIVILDQSMILPHAVNSGSAGYPDHEEYISFLKRNVSEVHLAPALDSGIPAVLRNLIVLGIACSHPKFPVRAEYIEESIRSSSRGNPELSLSVFRKYVTDKSISV